jgi:hypothetical protein
MVLQEYLTGLILRSARKYIRNIEANLNLSLWGGDVVLNNLDLDLEGRRALCGSALHSCLRSASSQTICNSG